MSQANQKPEGKKACDVESDLYKEISLPGHREGWRREEADSVGAATENPAWRSIMIILILHVRELKY